MDVYDSAWVMQQELNIAWTTVETKEAAEELANWWVEEQAAVCVQMEGPIESVYRWEGKIQVSKEYRLTVKFLSGQQKNVESILKQHHPYEVPQWVVVKATHVGEAYLEWAEGLSK